MGEARLTAEHLRLALNTVGPPYKTALAGHIASLESQLREQDSLLATRNQLNAALSAENDRMRAKLLELAGECANCNGTNKVTIRGMCGGVEMDCDDQPCPDCKDIRDAAEGRA